MRDGPRRTNFANRFAVTWGVNRFDPRHDKPHEPEIRSVSEQRPSFHVRLRASMRAGGRRAQAHQGKLVLLAILAAAVAAAKVFGIEVPSWLLPTP